jgi:hypothetical protein
LQKAESYNQAHRYFFALTTLERARHFASNIPSVELSYELAKKRYDLFLAERGIEENRIKQNGMEKVFETLLMVNAIPHAEKLLEQPTNFSAEFFQTKAPMLIKNAYDHLAEFTKRQDEFEKDQVIYQASYDLSLAHSVVNRDLLASEEVAFIEPEKAAFDLPPNTSRMTYLRTTKPLKSKGADIKSELATIANLEPFVYGNDALSRFVTLPVFVAEKKEPEVKKPVAIAISRPLDAPPIVPAGKAKTPVDRLGTQLVETAMKYSGKDLCAKAWYQSAKKSSLIACHDRIVGSEKPIGLVVVPLNNDSKKLYAISENPVSIGDYNRYCLLSRECAPLIDKPALAKKMPKKDNDLPEAGLDLSDVQETIAEYDEFCTISGTCTGTVGEKNAKPITSLTQQQINAYLLWLSKSTNQTYRLPTVEERLYALSVNPNTKLSLQGQPSETGFHVVREIH